MVTSKYVDLVLINRELKTLHFVKGIVRHSGNYAHVPFCQELEKNIYTIFMSVQ